MKPSTEPRHATSTKELKKIANKQANIYRSFNYVGSKETLAYLFNDFSNSFHINGYKERFIWDVVKVDFGISAIVNIFTGAWDVINDTFIAAIVDNTRTRIGKFRPYLVTFQIPLALFGIIYWLIPYFFPNTSGTFIPKLIFYFAFNIIAETTDTFTSVARGGYMSTITPNPTERIRLITLAELLTGYMGEDIPGYVMGFLYDMVTTGKLNVPLRSVFLGVGGTAAVISCICTLWFFLVSKERVPQTIERPSVKEGLRAIFTNYPVLLMCLSDFLGGFGIGTSERNYWIDVHGGKSMINTTLALVSGISGPVGSVSYAFVAPARKRFSSRAIWVGSDIYGDMVVLGFFLFGMHKKNYLKLPPMLVAYGIREFLTKLLFGVNKVINTDLWNEAMDYCEWKHGYRMEATTGVARGLVLKLQRIVMSTIHTVVMKKIGYVQGLKIGTQDEKTKFWLFALCTVVPLITSALGIVPKMLWPIDKKTREKMYYELSERRKQRVSDYLDTVEGEETSPEPTGQES
ncbi:MAG: MFS transporter [Clostridiales bacterium]|nr:MFS transporter [Clostridiales bacterium]